MSNDTIWYRKEVWIIVLLIFFFPAGLYLMWKYSGWNKIIKVIITIILALTTISAMTNPAKYTENKSKNIDSAKINTQEKTQQSKTPEPKQPSIPTEYKSALSKATSYSNTMHMSKKGVYDQLVSEYGEKFVPEAAQYAIDNVKADWNANALAKAKIYQNDMKMSPAAIHDQLLSEYGEKFTLPEADYAIANLDK